MNIRLRGVRTLAAGVFFAGLFGTASAAFNIAQVPLFISTNTQPNIMLMIDNSGSMNNIIWDVDPANTPDIPAYDPATTYPHWGLGQVFTGVDRNGNEFTVVVGDWAVGEDNIGLTALRSCAGSNSVRRYGRRQNADGTFTAMCLAIPARFTTDRYSGNYLSFLFESYYDIAVANGTTASLVRHQDGTQETVPYTPQSYFDVPLDRRIDVAKDVAASLVDRNQTLRFGVAQFNPPIRGEGGPGGIVSANCGAPVADVQGAISALSASTNTPLAETFYEVTRYFRGLPSFFNEGVVYTSPMQYRCQKNFNVVISDGFPTWDSQYPADDPDDLLIGSRSLPNWDGVAPTTTQAQFPFLPQYSDGYSADPNKTGGIGNEAHDLYLDDLALFAAQLDVKNSGLDLSGKSYEDADNPGENFDPQNINTYTVGFALENQMLIDAASPERGDGGFFRADNREQLLQSLESAVQDILARTSSAASVATNSTRLSSGALLFQATFSSGDWSGELRARRINQDGTIGDTAWLASQQVPLPAARKIFTTNADTRAGVAFTYDALSPSQKILLSSGTLAGGETAEQLGRKIVSLVRGNNLPDDDRFRVRDTRLGDIINSDPAFIGEQDFGFRRLPGAEGGSYPAFVRSKVNRSRAVFVGANDGMLHGFDGTTGAEIYGYVPRGVYSKLPNLVAQGYEASHLYFVDGSTRTVDAYLGGNWKSIVLGSTGAGGRSVFAIDATAPGSMSESSILWELTNDDTAELGVSLPIVTAARTANGRWTAIIANGYNSAGDDARLLFVDLETGTVVRSLLLGTGDASTPNGLSSAIPVDLDNDKITDVIYAGDLRGNLWKIDVSGASPSDWRSAFGTNANPAPLFIACSADPCTSSNRQPITARPEVGLNPAGGVIVYFGTGKYFEIADTVLVDNEPTMSFYGIFDDNVAVGGRNGLLEQTVEATGVTNGITFRRSSANTLSGEDGWFIDLPANGERQVATPLLRTGRIIFTTLIPDSDPCGAGGTGFLMELDAVTGSRLDETPFDLNNDGVFDENDYVETVIDGETVRVPVSGLQSEVGIIKTPAVLLPEEGGNPDQQVAEFKFFGGSDTTGGNEGVQVVTESSGLERGRLSWRQIQ